VTGVRKPLTLVVSFFSVAVLAGVAASAPLSDIYITGKVLGRVAGKNTSLVSIAWTYKCLGETRGSSYEWTLKVIRNRPLPKKTTTLGTGTSARGSKTVTLGPGEYLPLASPYRCETSVGAGFDKAEVGGAFTVPNYCAWSLSAVRGAVELEQGSAVKAARSGLRAGPGDALATPKNGSAAAASVGGDGTLSLGGSSRLEVDPARCAAKGGWLLRLRSGTVTVGVPAKADASRTYGVATRLITVTGSKGARWSVKTSAGSVTARALQGAVRVVPKRGAAFTLKVGTPVTIKS
jgi:hypothetical protein